MDFRRQRASRTIGEYSAVCVTGEVAARCNRAWPGKMDRRRSAVAPSGLQFRGNQGLFCLLSPERQSRRPRLTSGRRGYTLHQEGNFAKAEEFPQSPRASPKSFFQPHLFGHVLFLDWVGSLCVQVPTRKGRSIHDPGISGRHRTHPLHRSL
jgi:hypothetical protein